MEPRAKLAIGDVSAGHDRRHRAQAPGERGAASAFRLVTISVQQSGCRTSPVSRSLELRAAPRRAPTRKSSTSFSLQRRGGFARSCWTGREEAPGKLGDASVELCFRRRHPGSATPRLGPTSCGGRTPRWETSVDT